MDINKKIITLKKPRLYLTWKHIFIAATVLMSLIAIIVVGLTAMRFVRVGDIEITGLNPYDRVELLETMSIADNTFWWTVDEKEIEERLVSERQLLSVVKVTKKFPNRIEVEIVESRTPRWYIDISGRKYSLDGDLYVIEETKNTTGATKLVLPYISEVIERKVPKFGQSETEIKKTLEIIEIVRKSDIRSRITELDLSQRTDITLVIDGKYEVKLGDSKDLEGKLVMVKNTLEDEKVKNSKGGQIIAYTYSKGGYASFYESSEN